MIGRCFVLTVSLSSLKKKKKKSQQKPFCSFRLEPSVLYPSHLLHQECALEVARLSNRTWKKRQKKKWKHEKESELRSCVKDSRGGRPGHPVPNTPYGLCGRKATLNLNMGKNRGEIKESALLLCQRTTRLLQRLLKPRFPKVSPYHLRAENPLMRTRVNLSLTLTNVLSAWRHRP